MIYLTQINKTDQTSLPNLHGNDLRQFKEQLNCQMDIFVNTVIHDNTIIYGNR